MSGRKGSRGRVAETFDTRRKVKEKQAEATSFGGRDCSIIRQEVQSEMAAMLSRQALAKWPSFLEDVCQVTELWRKILTRYLRFNRFTTFVQGCRDF